ncbi:MAG: hypothetical protein MJA27_22905, partial [Pseudanabaenales cyanobacterium]|nr:hypothetical protein [Pseudanabaenales cyanobacterium]
IAWNSQTIQNTPNRVPGIADHKNERCLGKTLAQFIIKKCKVWGLVQAGREIKFVRLDKIREWKLSIKEFISPVTFTIDLVKHIKGDLLTADFS